MEEGFLTKIPYWILQNQRALPAGTILNIPLLNGKKTFSQGGVLETGAPVIKKKLGEFFKENWERAKKFSSNQSWEKTLPKNRARGV